MLIQESTCTKMEVNSNSSILLDVVTSRGNEYIMMDNYQQDLHKTH